MSLFLGGLVDMLEADAGVAALVDNRVYPFPAPQGVVSPYITYQVAGSSPLRTFEGPTYDDWLVQIDCWVLESPNTGSRYSVALNIAEAVRGCLDDQGGILNGQEVSSIEWEGERDSQEGEWRRRSLDFSFKVRR